MAGWCPLRYDVAAGPAPAGRHATRKAADVAVLLCGQRLEVHRIGARRGGHRPVDGAGSRVLAVRDPPTLSLPADGSRVRRQGPCASCYPAAVPRSTSCENRASSSGHLQRSLVVLEDERGVVRGKHAEQLKQAPPAEPWAMPPVRSSPPVR